MSDGIQGSSSQEGLNALKTASSSSEQENLSAENTNVTSENNTNDVDNAEVVDLGLLFCPTINIMLRNPLPPPSPTLEPTPPFSPATRSRIVDLLASQNIVGDLENVLGVLAQTIADFHPYLIVGEAITIPEPAQINISQYSQETFGHASMEEMWGHVNLPFQIVLDDQTSEETVEVFYDASSEEGDGDDGNDEPNDIVTDDDMTREELIAMEGKYGIPEYIIMQHLNLEVHSKSLTSNPQSVDSCRICLETYGDGDKTAKLACGDRFHYYCINRWLSKKNVCPLCRRIGLDV